MKTVSAIGAFMRRGSSRPVWFAVVGGGAFVIDMAVLAIAVHALGLAPAGARVLSILAASSAAWFANRQLTFAARRRRAWLTEWLRYLAVNALGIALNYASYVAIISLTDIGRAHPLLSIVPGGVIALALNYGLSARLVFRRRVLSSDR